jgi:hypothetical protein
VLCCGFLERPAPKSLVAALVSLGRSTSGFYVLRKTRCGLDLLAGDSEDAPIKESIDLLSCRGVRLGSIPAGSRATPECTFSLELPTQTHYFVAPSREYAQRWVATIEDHLRFLHTAPPSGELPRLAAPLALTLLVRRMSQSRRT